MTSETSLKPCPFCGAPAEMDTRQAFRSIFDGKMLDQVSIYCTSCSANVSHHPGDLSCSREATIDICVEEWNARAAIAAMSPQEVNSEALSELIAGDADLYDTPSARITGDKDRENPVEGAQPVAWLPIEGAPEDEEVLVLRRDGQMHVARVSGYDRKYGILQADFGNSSCCFFFPVSNNYEDEDAPTHWMPLPQPPEPA